MSSPVDGELGAVDVALRIPELGAQKCLRAVRERLVDVDPQAELRRLALDRARLRAAPGRRRSSLGRSRGSVSRDARDDKEQRDLRVLEHVPSESASRFPGRSGRSSVRSSRMRTKPAGSPRGQTSHVPSAADVARQRNGERSTNWRVRSFSRSVTFAWTTLGRLAEQSRGGRFSCGRRSSRRAYLGEHPTTATSSGKYRPSVPQASCFASPQSRIRSRSSPSSSEKQVEAAADAARP